MATYSIHKISAEGNILNTDIYSLDGLLTEGEHVGVITPKNQIYSDPGVNHFLLNRYQSLDSANQALEYLKNNNFDFSASYDSFCVEGKTTVPKIVALNSFMSGFFISSLWENTLLVYNSIRGKDTNPRADKINKIVGIPHLALSYSSLIGFVSTIGKNIETSHSANIIESIQGLKNLYYNLSLFSIGSGVYDLGSGFKLKKTLNNNIDSLIEMSDPLLKKKSYQYKKIKKELKQQSKKNYEYNQVNRRANCELAGGSSKIMGGILMYTASAMEWMTMSGQGDSLSLITKGASIAPMFGIAGLSLMALGFSLISGEYIYAKFNQYVKNYKDYKAGRTADKPSCRHSAHTTKPIRSKYSKTYDFVYSGYKKVKDKVKVKYNDLKLKYQNHKSKPKKII